MVCKYSSNKETVIVTKNKFVLLEADRLGAVLAMGLCSWRSGTPWAHLQRDILSPSCQTSPAVSSRGCPERVNATPNHIRQHHDPSPETGLWPHGFHQLHWHLRHYGVIPTKYTTFATFPSSVDVHSLFGGLRVRKRRGLPCLYQELRF